MTQDKKPSGSEKRQGRPPLLDPAECLRLCKSTGGFGSAAAALAAAGVENPGTGRPFTKHAIRYAAQRAPGYEAWYQRVSREWDAAKNNLSRAIARAAAEISAAKKVSKQAAEVLKGTKPAKKASP